MTNATLTIEVNPRASGRNGDDRAWQAAHEALCSGHWGRAVEALRTLNAFFTPYAADSLVTLAALREAGMATPANGLARMLDGEIARWNEAVTVAWAALD